MGPVIRVLGIRSLPPLQMDDDAFAVTVECLVLIIGEVGTKCLVWDAGNIWMDFSDNLVRTEAVEIRCDGVLAALDIYFYQVDGGPTQAGDGRREREGWHLE